MTIVATTAADHFTNCYFPGCHLHLPLFVEVILLRGKELGDEQRRRLLHVVDPPQGVAQEVPTHQPRQAWQG